MSFQEGSLIGEKYRLGASLGEGGMGTVYEAAEIRSGEQFAIKILEKSPRTRDPRDLDRLHREGRILSGLKHPHVVRVVDLGVDPGTSVPFLVMERLYGEDCGRRIAAQGAMSSRNARALLDQVCDALRALHARGVVHRDLKPENVFISRSRQGQEVVKLLDFGIAKVVSDGVNNSIVIGTPHCISPEQLQLHAPITPATDIWALALLAFFVLSGKHYWLEANPSQPSQVDYGKIFAEITNETLREPPSKRAVRLKCPAGCIPSPKFDDWFGRCVVNDPARRIRDVETAHRELSTVWRVEIGKVRPMRATLSTLPENELIAHAVDELRKRLPDALQIMQESAIEHPLDRGTPAPAPGMHIPVDATALAWGTEPAPVPAVSAPAVTVKPVDPLFQPSPDNPPLQTVVVSISKDPAPPAAAPQDSVPDPPPPAPPPAPAIAPIPEQRKARKGKTAARSKKEESPAPNTKVVVILAAGVAVGISMLVALVVWQDAIRTLLGLQ